MIFTKEWWKAAGIRSLKTFAQAAVATIGTSAALGDVDWILVGSSAALAAVLSLLTSISGLPEVIGEPNTNVGVPPNDNE